MSRPSLDLWAKLVHLKKFRESQVLVRSKYQRAGFFKPFCKRTMSINKESIKQKGKKQPNAFSCCRNWAAVVKETGHYPDTLVVEPTSSKLLKIKQVEEADSSIYSNIRQTKKIKSNRDSFDWREKWGGHEFKCHYFAATNDVKVKSSICVFASLPYKTTAWI